MKKIFIFLTVIINLASMPFIIANKGLTRFLIDDKELTRFLIDDKELAPITLENKDQKWSIITNTNEIFTWIIKNKKLKLWEKQALLILKKKSNLFLTVRTNEIVALIIKNKELLSTDKELLSSFLITNKGWTLSIIKNKELTKKDVSHNILKNLNIGVIKENNAESILENLVKKYPEIKINIKIPNNNYNNLDEFYWANLQLRIVENFIVIKDSIGKIKMLIPDFGTKNIKIIFNIQDNLNQQIKSILEDYKIQILLSDITQFGNNTEFQLKQIFPNLNINNKIIWIFNIIEHLKTYLRDFIVVIDLIKTQWQLKKIYSWMTGMENKFKVLENKIKEYQTNLNKLTVNKNKNNNNRDYLTSCNNYGFLIAGILGISAGFSLVFPPLAGIIGTISAIGAGLSGSIASLCGLGAQKYS